MDDRKEVYLTAQQAKQIGLIKRIVKITPEKQNEVNAHVQRIAAMHTGISEFKISKIVAETEQQTQVNNLNTNNMTIEDLQAQHPALYASVLANGVTAGVAQERDRVGSWAAFSTIDPVAALAGIESGNTITATDISKFQVRAMTVGAVATLTEEGKDAPNAGTEKPATADVIADVEAKKLEDFAKKMNASAGVSVKPENTVK
jgi:hypothetical protein